MDANFEDFLNELKSCASPDLLYQKIISLGKCSSLVSQWDFLSSEKVVGCQSNLYVQATQEGDILYFKFFSDALFSQGLAALLIHFYSGQSIKFILSTPPQFIKDLNLGHLLSPGRSNGLNSLYKKIIEIAVTKAKSISST